MRFAETAIDMLKPTRNGTCRDRDFEPWVETLTMKKLVEDKFKGQSLVNSSATALVLVLNNTTPDDGWTNNDENMKGCSLFLPPKVSLVQLGEIAATSV